MKIFQKIRTLGLRLWLKSMPKKTKNIVAIITAIVLVGGSITGVALKIFSARDRTYTASEIYDLSKESVGEITTYDKKGNSVALGTGFVYKSSGVIITNYHVIEEAYSAEINLNESTYDIQYVLSYDKTIDLAILKIDTTNKFACLNISEHEISVGDIVYALGSSKGFTSTFSQGIVTYADREMENIHYIQHNADVSSGNSGGPLLNQYGEVIGINTATIKDSQSVNFAISVNELTNLTFGQRMTMSEVYEKECDVFTKVKNYVIQNGTYKDGDYELKLGSSYSSGLTVIRYISYTPAKDEIYFTITASDSMTSLVLVDIYIDEIDGVYSWVYADSTMDLMKGTLYASSFNSNTTLSYSYTNITSSSVKTKTRKLASTMVHALLVFLDTDLSDIGITAKDLGFLQY